MENTIRVVQVVLETHKNEKDEDVVGVLLSLLGREGGKIYETFTFTDPLDAKKIDPVIDAFVDYFKPLQSEVFDRPFLFQQAHQEARRVVRRMAFRVKKS